MQQPEDVLAHFGVKGMKWGVRKGNVTSRFKGAMTDRNNANINRDKIRLSRAKSLGKGETRVNQRRALRISKLTDQNKRIATGKMKVKDILKGLNTVSAMELVISVKPTVTRNKTDTKVTRQVKSDFKSMNNREFMKNYSTTKGAYERRVMAKGDPSRAKKKK